MKNEDSTQRLRQLGITPTVQRVMIMDYLRDTRKHPTVDDVFHAVSEKHTSLSRATVYNSLRVLVDAGAVCQLTIEKQAVRYDLFDKPHAHFLCRICHRLYDVDVTPGTSPGRIVEGHRVESATTYLYGVCSTCREITDEQRKTEGDHA
ncbi:transcriptional repressor [Candidatus Bipolaricaulota bacterium]|nr:transcriptional repressor [Candidatus Bipolaricaulota bacterium]